MKGPLLSALFFRLRPLIPFSALRLAATKKAVLTVTGKSQLLQDSAEGVKQAQVSADLELKLALRAPYVAPLNILQVSCGTREWYWRVEGGH